MQGILDSQKSIVSSWKNSRRSKKDCDFLSQVRSLCSCQLTEYDYRSISSKSITNSYKTAAKTSDDGCPYDKDDLGRATWGLLHTMAANYPDHPSKEQINDMSSFFSIFSKVYPCDSCAKDFQKELVNEPIVASSQHPLSQWLCRMHNKVNVKLGKPIFDCRLVLSIRDGWKDGSCD